jgi:hypothetical protein
VKQEDSYCPMLVRKTGLELVSMSFHGILGKLGYLTINAFFHGFPYDLPKNLPQLANLLARNFTANNP